MKKTFVILMLFTAIFSFHLSCAQNPEIKRTNHWYFGHGCGLDFSSGSPIVDTNGDLNSFESCASMSDTAGNLLFYTDGDTVWNRLHLPMPNGTGLLGCGNWGSSTSAGLIVPWPTQEDSLFYIFTTDCAENSFADGFRYSVVNLNLDSGKGDVYIKNQLLLQNGTEGITVTKHANGVDFWLVTHEEGNNNYFIYLITSLGIASPLIQPIGPNALGYLSYVRFSGDGYSMVGSFALPANLFHFDNTNGQLFDMVNLQVLCDSPEFSPDNSKLYSNCGGNQLLVYCLDSWDSVSINSSYLEYFFNLDNDAFGVLKCAPDGKIYIASLWGSYDSISVIHNPNGYGSQINIAPLSFSTYPAGRSWGGLPNFVSNYLDFHQTPSLCDSTIGIIENHDDMIIVFPNPTSKELDIKNIAESGKKQIFIYGYSGNLILQTQTDFDSVKIDLSGLAESLYFLKIQSKNKIINKKFIVKH